jgi:DNA-binding NarL/FixJ family response regulator
MPDTVTLRCLIVDDNPQFLAAAGELLRRERVEVVGVASTIAEAVRMVGEMRPDVALVDVCLGPEDGFDLALRLARHPEELRPVVILISTHAEEDLADVIAASPAAGFLAKSELSAAAIHTVLRNQLL